jgi:genome maintenance exonuclease 1
MKWNKRFEYPSSTRALINGKRHYDVGTEEKLPSVTTILSATQSEEKKESLAKWKQKVGEIEADKIRDSAAERGTIMHRIIEGHLLGQRHADFSDLGQNAGTMAQKIIDEGLEGRMDEIWGSEITIYYPGLFAGATDLAGIYEGRESIIDFKQSNKLKRKEWIEDYFIQLAAYALGHNYVYNTSIQSGTILMCTKDNIFQRFDITGEEFKKYTYKWLERVDQYYCNIGNVTGESKKSE